MTIFNTLPPGIVVPFGGSSAPPGWLLCDGSPVSRTVYQNLFLSIGTVWGNGDGSTTFHLPDLRGRFLRGKDGGIGRDPDRTTRTAANPGGNTGDNVGSVQDNAHGHDHANTRSATSAIPSVNHTHGNTGWISNNHGHYIYGNNSHTHWRTDAHFSSPPSASLFGTNQTYDSDNGRYTHGINSNTTGNHEHWTAGIDTNHQHNSDGRSADHTHVATAGVTINSNGTTTETRPLNANVNYIIKI
jgi:microcystin-dependent protein